MGWSIVRIYTGIFTAVFLAHLGWRVHEQSQLNSAIEAIHAVGEPNLPEDFNHAPSRDPHNPVPWWRAAYAALDEDSIMLVDDIKLPLTPREASRLHGVVDQNAGAIELARTAAAKTGPAEWDIHIRTPMIETRCSDLRKQRAVANLLRIAAIDAHQRGDDASAIELIRDLFSLERSLYNYPVRLGHLVGLSVGAMGCGVIRQIVPEIEIDSTDRGGRPVSSDQVVVLIAALANDHLPLETQRRAFVADRAQLADSILHLFRDLRKDNPVQGMLVEYFSSSRLYAATCDVLMVAGERLNVANSDDWPTCRANLRNLPGHSDHDLLSDWARDTVLISWEREWQQDYRQQTEKRLCVAALASRLFALRHGGHLPSTLADLVPDYLSQVPLDPMAHNSLLHYRGPKDALIYSVGDDGIDDGGSEQPLNAQDPDNPWTQKDVVLHLTKQPRTQSEQMPAADQADPATRPSLYPGTIGPPVRR